MNQQNKNQTKISLLLLTHNEEGSITKNFSWLDKCPVINEIIAIDDHSTDNTVKTLKTLANQNRRVEVKSRGLANNFAAQRQFGLKFTTNDWILWLDPDEKPSSKLIEFLNHFDTKQHNYSFKRQENFLDFELKYGETPLLNFTRLFNKNHGKFVGTVHETWQSSKLTVKTDIVIEHRPQKNLYQFLEKINYYSSIRAQEIFSQNIKTNLWQIIAYPTGKFLQNYLFRLGFLDSTPGIIFALTMSFHSFLVRAKLWQLWQK